MYAKNLWTLGKTRASKLTEKTSADLSVCRRSFLNKKEKTYMKTFRRIMAVLLLLLTILIVSYVVYTARQIPVDEGISEVIYEMATTA